MKILYKILVPAIFILSGTNSQAQLHPLTAQYFNNQYLINPALAGSSAGLKLNGAYRKLWDNVPGAPLTQNLSIDYGFNKVGIGLTLNNESAGLQRQTRVVGTYAYHLKLNEKNQLHFGVSLGFMSQRLENADIYGNPSDPTVGQYNDRKTYLDGDFGVAYTSSNGLNIQASIPNLKSVLKKDVIKLADVATFYSAVSYQINLSEGTEGVDIEPKVAYRGVKGFENIWDAGAQLQIANKQVFLIGMYHSTENATFGVGMDFKRKYLISGTYTTQTSALNAYTNGSFELSLRLSLPR